MVETVINICERLSPIFYKILYMSIVGSIIGIIIFLLIRIFDNKLSAKWKCIMWIIPIIFLIVPINRVQIKTSQKSTLSVAIDKVEESLTKVYNIDNEKLEDTYYKSEEKISKKEDNIKVISLLQIIPIIWIGIVILSISTFILGNANIIIKIHKTQNCKDCRIKNIFIKCKNKLKIHKDIEVRLQAFNNSPCIYGIFKPKILIPKDFLLSDDKTLKNIFMHELSHYKRKDIITNYILLLITTIHWFNPVVHYFFKKIRQDMEIATDEIALSKMSKEQKKQYGMTLISLLQTYKNEKIIIKSLCMADDSKNMERRIKMIKLSTKLRKNKIIVLSVTLSIISLLIIPFTIRPISLAETIENINNENIENNIVEEEKSSQVEWTNEENLNTSTTSNRESKYIQKEIKSNLFWEWIPYKATKDGKEVNLRDIYGTGINQYGGSLTINEDGTYEEYIGIYNGDDNSYTGDIYIVDEDEVQTTVILVSNNGEEMILRYIHEDDIMIKELYDGTLLYFMR